MSERGVQYEPEDCEATVDLGISDTAKLFSL